MSKYLRSRKGLCFLFVVFSVLYINTKDQIPATPTSNTVEKALPLRSDLVSANSTIYKPYLGWDTSPVVIEKYKLLFFTTPKVGCTTFKQLFRRMMNQPNFMTQNFARGLPHNPKTNGLRYLWDYTLEEANYMMTAAEYTRAIFVRDPKKRFLSAFLDKGVHNYGNFLESHCCPQNDQKCLPKNVHQIEGFIQLIQNCTDPHWRPQYHRMDPQQWGYINFLGHLERISVDGPRLLNKIGAGRYLRMGGWGGGNETRLFATSNQNHHTGAADNLNLMTPEISRIVEEYYRDDYSFPMFGFTK